MRKPVTIDRAKCGPLWNTLLTRCHELDACGEVLPTAGGVCALTGTARRVARDALERYATFTRELFGREDYTPAERAARDYLSSL